MQNRQEIFHQLALSTVNNCEGEIMISLTPVAIPHGVESTGLV